MACRSGRRARRSEPEPEATSVADYQVSAVEKAGLTRIVSQSELEEATEADAPDSAGASLDESGAPEEIAHLIGATTTTDAEDLLGQARPSEEELEALIGFGGDDGEGEEGSAGGPTSSTGEDGAG